MRGPQFHQPAGKHRRGILWTITRSGPFTPWPTTTPFKRAAPRWCAISFSFPPKAKGPLTVTARVNYRHLRQSYLNNVLGNDHPAYPVVELASRTRTLNTRRQSAPRLRCPTIIRIGCAGTISASPISTNCNTPTPCMPSSRWSSCGRTMRTGTSISALLISSGKNIAKPRAAGKGACAQPDNARALYYLALVERRQGHSDEEIADLQEVVAQYPQSRDARRELGISYYQQHTCRRSHRAVRGPAGDRSRRSGRALQPGHPLSPHGHESKAAEEAALFATKQVDPGAPTYSLDFLRKHPEFRPRACPGTCIPIRRQRDEPPAQEARLRN